MPAPSALMMNPFTDTLGVFVIVPLYLNPATTIGGPTLPTAINTPPTWTKNGSPIVFDLVTIDAELRAIVYQYPSWGHALATDVITMSAPQGWATTAGGDLGGTGSGGTSSTPIVVLNNVGRTVETQYDTASRAMPLAINVPPNGIEQLGQPRANHASRLRQSGWTGTVLTFDSTTLLPKTIGGGGVSCYLYNNNPNGIDSNTYPVTQGRWRVTWGDQSTGVDATHKKINIDLIGPTGWVEDPGGASPGTWDGTAWHGIVKEYVWTYSGTGNLGYIRFDLYSTAAGGDVTFPDKGSGQVELCVTAPSAANRNVANPASYDPLGIDPEYLAKHEAFRPRAVRWMPDSAGFDQTGDSSMMDVADLDQRKVNDFVWTKRTPYPDLAVNIIKVEPLPGSNAVIIPYQGSTQNFTLANWDDFSSRVVYLCTTDVDHQLKSNNFIGTRITPTTTAPNPVVDTGLTLTANITTTSGTTTISVSSTAGVASFIEIDSEQLGVLAILGPTSLSVSRGINGTTGATHTSGVSVYTGVTFNSGFLPVWVTGARTFISQDLNFAVGANQTVRGTVNYTPPNSPSFGQSLPQNNGSVPYEFQAKTTNAIAVANGSETILWTNFALLASDALITEVVQNRIAPYITSSHVKIIAELSNELWNTAFHGYTACIILYRTAPNPETSGTGFIGAREFIASRQNHINVVVEAAAVAGGLGVGRVYNFQPGHAQNNFVQGDTTETIIYCQANSFPIDYMSMGGYVGLTPQPWSLFWHWMSVTDGGSATWSRGSATADRAWARRVHMSYMRAWFWFSPFVGVSVTGAAQAMAWYKAGKSVANAGVGSATPNSGLGKMCIYEGGTELDADTGGAFAQPVAMEHDWAQDGIPQYTGDTGWYATETAFFAAVQGAALMYANLMPAASFPDLTSATMGFLCYFALIYVAPNVGDAQGEALYDVYDWQGQQPGYGAANVMGWDPTTPVFQTWQNVSVRAQAIIDWNAAPVPATSGGKASNFAIIMAGI